LNGLLHPTLFGLNGNRIAWFVFVQNRLDLGNFRYRLPIEDKNAIAAVQTGFV
jgi:hypothetical protein